MKKILSSAAILFLFSDYALAFPATPNSYHFQAVPNSSITCNATTSGVTVNFGSDTGAASLAPDVVIRNIGMVPVYFELTNSGGPTAAVATSQVINPGESDLLSKYQTDTVSCITSSGSAAIIATPGTGN